MKRWLVLGVVLVAACGQSGAHQSMRRDSLTQRQRDSIVAASKLPGANAVGKALRASDAAEARQKMLDSISR